jgi:hypothetical protein
MIEQAPLSQGYPGYPFTNTTDTGGKLRGSWYMYHARCPMYNVPAPWSSRDLRAPCSAVLCRLWLCMLLIASYSYKDKSRPPIRIMHGVKPLLPVCPSHLTVYFKEYDMRYACEWGQDILWIFVHLFFWVFAFGSHQVAYTFGGGTGGPISIETDIGIEAGWIARRKNVWYQVSGIAERKVKGEGKTGSYLCDANREK